MKQKKDMGCEKFSNDNTYFTLNTPVCRDWKMLTIVPAKELDPYQRVSLVLH